jgi:uncharacterized protein YjiS (DUF1127 family)
MTHLRKKVARWLNRQSRIRNTVRELNALTDRDLADIGLARCDIGRVAQEVVL